MVAFAAIADDMWEPPQVGPVALRVTIPAHLAPLPTPLAPGEKPGFAIRGTKGWRWTTEQYLSEIPVLASYGGNFLMNCYSSLFSHFPEFHNEWWRPLGAERKAGLARIIRSCSQHRGTFCFAYHPQFGSPRPLDPESDADFARMWEHYAWAQRQGVRWFCLSLDDVTWGEDGPAVGGRRHGEFATRLLLRLRQRDTGAQLSFVPVVYWGDGSDSESHAYLEALGEALHPDVCVFWTGDGVVTPCITRAAAERYKAVVQHRLLLWDNYPVNDAQHALHLGPVIGRDPDLHEVVDGYVSNPHCEQNQANRIPLLTFLDYAYNPRAYDPARSIGQAIAHLTRSPVERAVLAQLTETYPGMLYTGGGTGTNSLRTRFSLAASPEEAEAILRRAQTLLRALERELPDDYVPARRILQGDVTWMADQLHR
jgi:hyaluronoglucosaminidase